MSGAPARCGIAAIAFAALACGGPPGEPASLGALREAAAEFHAALNRGDAERVVAAFTDDAIFMSSGAEVIRGDAVRESWRRSTLAGFRTRAHDTIELSVSGDVGYEVVSQEWTVLEDGRPGPWRRSKYVHIWKRQADGTWRLHLDIWNASPDLEGR